MSEPMHNICQKDSKRLLVISVKSRATRYLIKIFYIDTNENVTIHCVFDNYSVSFLDSPIQHVILPIKQTRT